MTQLLEGRIKALEDGLLTVSAGSHNPEKDEWKSTVLSQIAELQSRVLAMEEANSSTLGRLEAQQAEELRCLQAIEECLQDLEDEVEDLAEEKGNPSHNPGLLQLEAPAVEEVMVPKETSESPKKSRSTSWWEALLGAR